MLLNTITINGKETETYLSVSNKYGEAIGAYNFKDENELQMIIELDDRCRLQNYFNWSPADTKTLERILGI